MQRNHPAVNITELEKGFDITLMAPGLSKADFKISVEDDQLTISYEKKEEKSEETPKFIRREFALKSFSRSFTLNDQLNKEQISATYENGLLTVHVPKLETAQAEPSVKTISVN